MSSIEVSIQLTTSGSVSLSSQSGFRYDGIELGVTVVLVVLSGKSITGTNALVPSLGFFFLLLPNTAPIMTTSIRSRMDDRNRHTFLLLVGLKSLATAILLSFASSSL